MKTCLSLFLVRYIGSQSPKHPPFLVLVLVWAFGTLIEAPIFGAWAFATHSKSLWKPIFGGILGFAFGTTIEAYRSPFLGGFGPSEPLAKPIEAHFWGLGPSEPLSKPVETHFWGHVLGFGPSEPLSKPIEAYFWGHVLGFGPSEALSKPIEAY